MATAIRERSLVRQLFARRAHAAIGTFVPAKNGMTRPLETTGSPAEIADRSHSARTLARRRRRVRMRCAFALAFGMGTMIAGAIFDSPLAAAALGLLWASMRRAFGRDAIRHGFAPADIFNEGLAILVVAALAFGLAPDRVRAAGPVPLLIVVVGAVLLTLVTRWDGGGQDVDLLRARLRAKRSLDLIIALILALPILVATLCVAGTIAIVDRQFPFFLQTRLTRHRRPFRLIKLRTMRPSGPPGSRPRWTAIDDPRITPLGRWVRLLHLDELPQLWNVVTGDLSWVGPRPERPEYAQVFEAKLPMYHQRYRVPGGITGSAQVDGFAGNTSIRGRLDRDRYYVDRFDNIYDLWLIVLTVLRSIWPKSQEQIDYSPDDDAEVP